MVDPRSEPRSEPRSRPDLPVGFAHRGARAERPDNTLESFTRAIELGATALESDAWLTADDEVVLDHDGIVRQGWHRRPIRALPVSSLPAHIPRLSELYATCGTGHQLSLDVKDPAAGSAAIAVAEGFGAVDRLWLCSSEVGLLAGWRVETGQVRLVLSTRRADLADDGISGAGSFGGGGVRLAAHGVDAINLRESDWDAALVDDVHRAGLLAFGWDAQGDRQLDRLLGLGVDGVYCDHIARMVDALSRHHQAGGGLSH